ncbi:MAG: trypsin-like peptidase domain-containing protein [Bacteroidia bacterium]|nr:trypsin-like peptidase domain-containing protein [Bacteroidia bacterium]
MEFTMPGTGKAGLISIIYIIIILLINPLFTGAFCQNLKNVKLSSDNSKVFISYDLVDCKGSDRYLPRVEIHLYQTGSKTADKISAKSFKYDTVIRCGNNNIITWSARDDGFVLNNEIYSIVYAKKALKVRTTEHILKSVIWPGFGDYKLRNGKYYFLYGALGYGLIGTSIYLQSRALNSYEQYKNSTDIAESDRYFTKAIQQRNISYILLGGAMIVWTVDFAGILFKAKSLKKNLTPEKSKYYFKQANDEIYEKSNNAKIDIRTDYEKAMDTGRDLKNKCESLGLICKSVSDAITALSVYNQAKSYFKDALKYKPDDIEAQKESDKVETKIKNIENKREQYNNLINRGDSLLALNNFSSATLAYEEAKLIYPNEKYPEDKLLEIKKRKENIRIDNEYKQYITMADSLFLAKMLEDSKDLYQKASTLRPDSIYPKNRISEINGIITTNNFNIKIKEAEKLFTAKKYGEAKVLYEEAADIMSDNSITGNKIKQCENKMTEIEQAKIDKEYKENIIKADKAYNNKKYDEAKQYYEKASSLKQDETYPKNRIESINNLLQIIIEKKGSLSELYKKCKDAVFFVLASDYIGISQGSGFFIDSKGVALSNYHVFEGNFISKIYTNDGGEYEIDVLERNKEKDYIIFKVKNPGNKKFECVEIATVLPEIGETVFTIGNPEGLEQTPSNGILTGYRDTEENGKNFYIQTNTSITNGSSGGPLFNSKGEVIGITSRGQQAGSLFFAINIQKIPYKKYINK